LVPQAPASAVGGSHTDCCVHASPGSHVLFAQQLWSAPPHAPQLPFGMHASPGMQLESSQHATPSVPQGTQNGPQLGLGWQKKPGSQTPHVTPFPSRGAHIEPALVMRPG
jgi:hypothetical protein